MKIIPPRRVRHSYMQSLNAPPEKVFPLLCPVRETEWVKGWDPELVLSNSGVAEPDGVFVTPAAAGQIIWVITRYDPALYVLEFVKVTPGQTVGKIEIELSDDGRGGTRADVAYGYTSLGPDGDDFLETFTAEWYEGFMKQWETELNHYLATGEKLT
jgi:hypothetical protein